MLLITRLYIRFWKRRHRSSRFIESKPGHTLLERAAPLNEGQVQDIELAKISQRGMRTYAQTQFALWLRFNLLITMRRAWWLTVKTQRSNYTVTLCSRNLCRAG